MPAIALRAFLGIATLLLFADRTPAQGCAINPSADDGSYFYTSTSSTVNIDLTQVTPPVNNPPDADTYLQTTSCLSYLGPIGPYGPLGALGPLGNSSWNPEYWISGAFDWSTFQQNVTGMGGPLSALGPLGQNGPMSDNAFYNTMGCINDFAHQMAAKGVWSVLGPLGPLGPLGALGPLGPIGAHGYQADRNGQYTDGNGQVVRTFTVPFNSSYSRTFELFESYTQAFAQSFRAQDTSFMVHGVWDGTNPQTSTFPLVSKQDQVVTILLVPMYQFDSFQLVLSRGQTQLVQTYELTFPEWIQFRAKANSAFTIAVSLQYSAQPLSNEYFLYVVGSTNEFQWSDIGGPQIQNS